MIAAIVLGVVPVKRWTGLQVELSVAMAPTLLGTGISVVAAVTFISLWVVTGKAVDSLNRSWLCTAGAVLWFANGTILIAGAASGDILGVTIAPYWLLGPAAVLCLAVLAAPGLGDARLRAARGEFRSGRYRRMLTPRNEDADQRYWSWLTGFRNAVRDGKTDLRALKGEAKKLAQALHLERSAPRTKGNRADPRRS